MERYDSSGFSKLRPFVGLCFPMESKLWLL